MLDDFKIVLDKEIEAIQSTQTYYENSGFHTLRAIQMVYEVEPPITDEDKKKSNDINKEIADIYVYQTLLSKLKKQLEDTKVIVIEVEKFKDK